MRAISADISSNLRPMNRLMENTVFFGFVTAWRLAALPTSRSPLFVKATIDGVVRPPSAFGITVGCPPSMTAMHEFVVPRSIPNTFDMLCPRFPKNGRHIATSQFLACNMRAK